MYIPKDLEMRPTENDTKERGRIQNEQRLERLDFVRQAAIAFCLQLDKGHEQDAEHLAWAKAERLWKAKPDSC
jgi:hypothetical protein